jgi:hypothetical protein
VDALRRTMLLTAARLIVVRSEGELSGVDRMAKHQSLAPLQQNHRC